MRCEIQLKERLAGFVAKAARGPGNVSVVLREFSSSEDGSHLISRLEGLQQCLIGHVPGCPPPSFIDSFLAVLRPDLRVSIFINDVPMRVSIRPKRTVKHGDVVYLDDVLDVERVELEEPIPEDCGLVLIRSFGWRKSLFFDFAPVCSNVARDYDLGAVLGVQHAYLTFQEHFRTSDNQWAELFRQHWFPFRFLPEKTLKAMLGHAENGWNIDELLDDSVLTAIEAAADPGAALLSGRPFLEHRALIAHAFERFRARDYKSAVAILVPRIEGVLRAIHAELGAERATSSALAASSTATYQKSRGDATLLMPDKFREYLQIVYFRSWKPGEGPSHVSRHTVSHGVAPEAMFNKKAAAVAVLTVLQIALYI
jgi:hypothetical protein